ncbi:uncharacterized protein V2V93DRAFT_375160 [Kockiozyma suomiensis]|uniref:uncharacterized protein n=1 Tax=Kockiozyma suomiensis TaxID=1337062 RepID=UPI003343813C
MSSQSGYDRYRPKAHSKQIIRNDQLSDDISSGKPIVTERDLLERSHRLIWDDKDDDADEENGPNGAEKQLSVTPSIDVRDREAKAAEYGRKIAKQYSAKLIKDFPIVDLSRYRSGQIGLRWRTLHEYEENIGGERGICAEVGCRVRDRDYRANSDSAQLWKDSGYHRADLEKRQALFRYSEPGGEGVPTERSIMVSCWLCPHHGRKLDRAHEYKKRLQLREKSSDRTDFRRFRHPSKSRALSKKAH